MRLKPISARTVTIGYTVALLIIASLSMASHIVLEYGLKSDEGSAAIINKSGRQRMLSQRIASLAIQYRQGDASVNDDLNSAIGEFETAHDFMVTTLQAGSLSDDNQRQLQEIFFNLPHPLDAQVHSFVSDARGLMQLSPGSAAIDPLLSRMLADARVPLLNTLNAVVTIEQRESEQRIVRLEHIQWSILSIVLVTLFVEATVIFRPMIRRTIEYTAELLRLATTDSLTGALNRRSFFEKCTNEIARSRRLGIPACMLMVDLDHFKKINDTYGHAAGDDALAAVGAAFRQTLRSIDIWGRLGGEEFGIFLSETNFSEAAIMAERLRACVDAISIQHGQHRIRLTVSIGCTTLPQEAGELDEVLRAADQLMYQAKQSGRNRVVLDARAGAGDIS